MMETFICLFDNRVHLPLQWMLSPEASNCSKLRHFGVFEALAIAQ